MSFLRLTTLALLVLLAGPTVSANDDDPLVIRARQLRITLPTERAVTISGSGSLQHTDGRTEVVLDRNVRIELNGDAVEGEAFALEGDVVTVTHDDGTRQWTIEVGSSPDSFMRITRTPLDVALRSATPLTRDFLSDAVSRRVVIGVTTSQPAEGLATQLGVVPEATLLVDEVHEGYPAEESGLLEHDLITRVDDDDSVTQESLREAIQAREPGEFVELQVLRRGKPLLLSVPVRLSEAETAWNLADPFTRFTTESEVRARLEGTMAQLEASENALATVQRNLQASQLQQAEMQQLLAQRLLMSEQTKAEADMDAEMLNEQLAREEVQSAVAMRQLEAALELQRGDMQAAEVALERARLDQAQRAEAMAELQATVGLLGRQLTDESRGIGFLQDGDARQSLLLLEEASRLAGTQDTGDGGAVQVRLDSLEDRMERIEAILMRLEERSR